MTPRPDELAKRVLRREWDNLSPRERRVIESVLKRVAVIRDTNREFQDARTFGERLADQIAALGGSWGFIVVFVIGLGAWVLLNSEVLGPRGEAFDPYPYILLNLFLSMLAALQAPVIMMSQNRQAEKDRLRAQHDYEVNLKAELEVRMLHEKLDLLREKQWSELLRMQQDQIRMLERLLSSALSHSAAADDPAATEPQ
jgi:uncharacterized membrane protein